MKLVWKFPLDPAYASPYEVRMPKGADMLTAAMQGDTLCVWAMVDPQAETVTRRFWVIGTGMSIGTGPFEQPNMRYVGTALENFLVWHVFVEVE
jgi:hypothetical protein